MRPIYPSDLDCVCRVLLACDADGRAALAGEIVGRARAADRYRKRFGRAHHVLGAGCLTSAAAGFARVPARTHCDASYRACLGKVLDALGPEPTDKHS